MQWLRSEYNKVEIKASDALFLHTSYHPNQSLVADISNGDYLENWRRSRMIALPMKQKLAFIDEFDLKSNVASPLLPYWQCCSDTVLSWLSTLQEKRPSIATFCAIVF